MKQYFKLAALALGVVAMGLTSCQKEPNGLFHLTAGQPTIKYIRLQDVTEGETIVTEASVQTGLTIIGENLTSIKEMYFNDKAAVLNTSHMTKNALLVSVPKDIPGEVSDQITMVTRDGDTCRYDFHVIVPAPSVNFMKNEYAKEGSTATIIGNFFVQDPNVPLTITFTGIQNSASVAVDPSTITVAENNASVSFTVPAGAPEGNVEVTTVYGTGVSHFYYHDSRGIFLNYEGEKFDQPYGLVPQGWNSAHLFVADDPTAVSGNYVQYPDPAKNAEGMPADGAWTEYYKVTYWCGNWNGDPMSVTSGAGAPLRNLFPAGYFAKPEDLVFKFEMRIPKDNPWKAGALQVLFVNNLICANDSWQNNTYIHTAADGGQDLPRGIYRPWAETGSFLTGDEWITVTMPLSDFVYNMDGTPTTKRLAEDSFDSFVMWPVAGGMAGEKCDPIFHYDNLRIAPKL